MNRIRVAGLDLPQVVELVWKLREKGIKIKEQVFSEEELMDFLKSFIHRIKISHLIRVTSVQSADPSFTLVRGTLPEPKEFTQKAEASRPLPFDSA